MLAGNLGQTQFHTRLMLAGNLGQTQIHTRLMLAGNLGQTQIQFLFTLAGNLKHLKIQSLQQRFTVAASISTTQARFRFNSHIFSVIAIKRTREVKPK